MPKGQKGRPSKAVPARKIQAPFVPTASLGIDNYWRKPSSSNSVIPLAAASSQPVTTTYNGKTPFVPSSAPGNEKYWRNTINTDQKSNNPKPHGKVRVSEYDDNFVEWDLPENNSNTNDRRFGPTGFYEVDVNVADWESEQKRSYSSRSPGITSERVAGISLPKRADISAAFNYDTDSQIVDEKFPESYNRDHTSSTSRKNKSHPPYRVLSSEQSSQYNWPETSEHTQTIRPDRISYKSSPYAVDNNNRPYQDGEDSDAACGGRWQSEYDLRCAELRKQQQNLQNAASSTAAGLKSNTNPDSLPAFCAWEGEFDDTGEDGAGPRPREKSVIQQHQDNSNMLVGYQRGTSEYKMKYVDWPLEQRSNHQPVAGIGGDKNRQQLDLFHNNDDGVVAPSATTSSTTTTQNQQERRRSVLHDSYPGYYDVITLQHEQQQQVAGAPSKGRDRSPDPIAFAWSLVDGAAPGDLDENGIAIVKDMKKRKSKQKNMTLNNNSSEYIRKFSQPIPPDAYITASAKPRSNSNLNLFVSEGKDIATNRSSEYTDQFQQRSPLQQQQIEEHALNCHPSLKHTSGISQQQKYPAQFAWSANSTTTTNTTTTNIEEDSEIRRPKRPLLPGQEMSEYQRKYHWPSSPTDRSIISTGSSSSVSCNGTGDIIGLDALDLDESKWQSEYDEQCARLRKQQYELQQQAAVNGGGGSTSKVCNTAAIAGLASRKKEETPFNYAWKEDEEVVHPAAFASKGTALLSYHYDDPAPQSEYNSNFIKWPLMQQQQEQHSSIPIRSSSKEVFNVLHSDSAGTAAADTTALGEEEMKLEHICSEYHDKFNGKTNGVNQDAPVRRPAGRSVHDQDALPYQFAWPPAPKSSPAAVLPNHVPFTEELSEQHAAFKWPPASGTAKIGIMRKQSQSSITGAHSPSSSSSVIVPILDKEAATSSQWTSEYDAHADDVINATTLSAASSLIPAGMITLKHEDVPAFYAWMDKEAKTTTSTVSEAPSLPRYSGEQIRSEYDESYQNWKQKLPSSSPEDVLMRSHCSSGISSSSVDYNVITTLTDTVASGCAPTQSEYASKFVAAAPLHDDNYSIANKENWKMTNEKEQSCRPLQFAWPKDATEDDNKKRKALLHGRTATASIPECGLSDCASEYASQFVKHSTDDITPALRRHTPTTQPKSHVISGSQIATEVDDNNGASDWQSEYDYQCHKSQSQTSSPSDAAAAASNDVTARLASLLESGSPAYFAWPQPPQPEQKPQRTGSSNNNENITEYSASFKPWQQKNYPENHSNRRGDHRYAMEALKNMTHLIPGGKKNGKLYGSMVTEYDDKFRGGGGSMIAAPTPDVIEKFLDKRKVEQQLQQACQDSLTTGVSSDAATAATAASNAAYKSNLNNSRHANTSIHFYPPPPPPATTSIVTTTGRIVRPSTSDTFTIISSDNNATDQTALTTVQRESYQWPSSSSSSSKRYQPQYLQHRLPSPPPAAVVVVTNNVTNKSNMNDTMSGSISDNNTDDYQINRSNTDSLHKLVPRENEKKETAKNYKLVNKRAVAISSRSPVKSSCSSSTGVTIGNSSTGRCPSGLSHLNNNSNNRNCVTTAGSTNPYFTSSSSSIDAAAAGNTISSTCTTIPRHFNTSVNNVSNAIKDSDEISNSNRRHSVCSSVAARDNISCPSHGSSVSTSLKTVVGDDTISTTATSTSSLASSSLMSSSQRRNRSDDGGNGTTTTITSMKNESIPATDICYPPKTSYYDRQHGAIKQQQQQEELRQQSQNKSRSISAPPKNQYRLMKNNTNEQLHHVKTKARIATDDTTSSFNPVLMHKRYPYVSAKQLGRWSTETGDQFKWRSNGKKPCGNSGGSPNSTAHYFNSP